MANWNYAPNARYDNGPNAAGSNGVNHLPEEMGLPAEICGLLSDGTRQLSPLRTGFSAAGVARTNRGGNVAGAPRSFNNT